MMRDLDSEAEAAAKTTMISSGVEPAPVSTSCSDCEAKQDEIDSLHEQVQWLVGFLSATKRRRFEQTFGTAMAHTGDPWASKFAALMQSSEKRWANRERVLRVLIARTEKGDGGTDDEMCFSAPPYGLGLDPDHDAYSTFRTCRTELRDLLVVRASGRHRPSQTTGSPAGVWEAIPNAMEEFQALRARSLAEKRRA